MASRKLTGDEAWKMKVTIRNGLFTDRIVAAGKNLAQEMHRDAIMSKDVVKVPAALLRAGVIKTADSIRIVVPKGLVKDMDSAKDTIVAKKTIPLVRALRTAIQVCKERQKMSAELDTILKSGKSLQALAKQVPSLEPYLKQVGFFLSDKEEDGAPVSLDKKLRKKLKVKK